MSDYTREAFERDRFATAGPVQPPATPQEPEQTWGPFFDQCEKCVTRTHCAHHDSCLAECVPADLRASTPSPEGQTWQPIETAPKEENCVLLFADGWGVHPGWWDSEHGWLACEEQGLTGGKFSEATHWMPLPNPPKCGDE